LHVLGDYSLRHCLGLVATPQGDSMKRTWRQRLKSWLFVAVLGYLGIIVMLSLLENFLVFRPAGPEDWEPPPTPKIQDVEFTSAGGDKIHGWWLPRERTRGVLLYFHGNAGNLSFRGNSMVKLSELLDQSLLIIDYPGYGKSSGQPSEAGCYAAADAAYDWLTGTKGYSSDRILLYGASLGGGVAVDLASRKPHRALILVKTFTSAPDVGTSVYPFLPIQWLMRNRFDSLAKIGQCKQPIFIAHGDADRIVPYVLGERLFRAAPQPKKFLRLPGADHNDSLPLEFFTALKQFLASEAVGQPASVAN
jgi:fermentation-respiration switch protein FrsA (DUF1100 family)